MQVCSMVKGGACAPITKIAKLLIKHHNNKNVPVYEETFFVGDFKEDLVITRSTCKCLNILLAYPELFFNHAPTVIPLLNGALSANNVAQVELAVGTPPECFWAQQDRINSTDKFQIAEVVAGDVQPSSSKLCAQCKAPALHACKACLDLGLPVESARFCCQSCYKTAWLNKQLHNISKMDIKSSNELNNFKLDTATLDSAMSTAGISTNTSSLQSSFSENYSRKVYANEDIYEIPEDKLEAIPSDLLYNNKPLGGDNDLPTQIFGSPELRERLTALILKFRHIFSRDVRADSAHLNPFKFQVDDSSWRTSKNRTARRKYDLSRQEELKKIISKLLEAGVIKPSRAAYYSHGFVVPKATPGQWRLVIDYKNLNKVCSTERWPIPDIKEILQRIGDKRPKIFNVMDMTSGYYQAPIDEQCWEYTAFMTHMGLYEWTRLPMGPTGACSFFQQALSTEVFDGLVQDICELYLDDLIVYASTDDECIANLETVFTRCVEKNLTLHPDKCRFGLSEVEYVGHTINDQGIHFSRQRLDSILNFPLPETQKALYSFLGFANYFRLHVRDYASMTAPLYEFIKNYNKKKNTEIQWTESTRKCFFDVREAVHNCPQLFFIDNVSEIFLHTDASDYGCGAYLYQLRKSIDHPLGEEVPIAFISKSFDARMRRWDTPQKEGFAIFYALLKLDYLLRDRRFTIRTDHKNLSILRGESYITNLKVQRWLTTFQHYDFNIEYVKGEINMIADALSRLCVRYEFIPIRSIKIQDDSNYFQWFLEVHNDLLGHSGEAETQRRLLKAEHRWTGMHRDIRRYIALCPTCQKNRQAINKNIAFPFTVSSYKPFEKIQMDFIVNLDKDDDGVDHIMVIIDTFSRWVTLATLKGLSARQAADILIQHCGRFGFPKFISHDQDAVFMGTIMQEAMQLLKSQSIPTMSYSKEESGIVERANKEVFRHIRNFIFDEAAKASYSRYIPFVERIINSSIHKATGFSPAQILFGNSVDLNRSTILESKYENIKDVSYSEWSHEALAMQLRIMELARAQLTEKDEVHMINYPALATTEFEVGSYVLVEYKNTFRRRPNSKLLPFLKGPLQVVNKEKSKYYLKDLITQKVKPYHVKRLTQFNFDIAKWDPLQVALRDTGNLFQVSQISGYKGKINGPKSQLFFLVHWVGYDEPTWEPWGNLRSNIKFHEYLRTHRNKSLQKLLPPQYENSSAIIEESSESEDDFDT